LPRVCWDHDRRRPFMWWGHRSPIRKFYIDGD